MDPIFGTNVGISFLSGSADTPAVIRLSGELDLSTACGVQEALTVEWRYPRDVVIDLSALAFCDCAGIRAFLNAARSRAEQQSTLWLAAPQGIVRTLLEALHIGDMVPVYASLAAAVSRDDSQRICRSAQPSPAAGDRPDQNLARSGLAVSPGH